MRISIMVLVFYNKLKLFTKWYESYTLTQLHYTKLELFLIHDKLIPTQYVMISFLTNVYHMICNVA